MDGERFDTLTRWFAPGRSRRQVVRALAGAWAAGAGLRAGLAPAPGAAAPCQGAGKPCDKSGDCCGGMTCKTGKCRCKGKTKACGDACCGTAEQCVETGGKQACCPDLKVCDGTCCGPHRVCICPKPPDIPGVPTPPCVCRCESGWSENAQGECICATVLCGLECCETDQGEQCCDGPDAEVCTNVKISERHCGQCGHPCGDGRQCVGGECRCANGYVECDGTCIKHELGNCCTDRHCHADPFPCLNPPCFPDVEDYPEHTICCENRCRADFRDDVNNCGACGQKCAAGEMCCDTSDSYRGRCLPFVECCASKGAPGQFTVCEASPTAFKPAYCCDSNREQCCEGSCHDLDSWVHCGRCGNMCPGPKVCCDLPPGQGGPTCRSRGACNRRRRR